MNPVHLETLLAIVDEGSFDVAAAVLGISPSAVSQRIKALESSTGRVLLRRATPVTATEAGEILVQSARRMALVQAETDARLGQRLARVPLSVAVNSDIAESFHSGRLTWETMPLVGYGPNDQVLDDAMRERFIDSAVVRARVSQIPSSEGYLEAVRVGLGWGLLPQAQALPLLEAKELVLLDGSPLDIDLYWQRWRLESEVLGELTRSVIEAASGLEAL